MESVFNHVPLVGKPIARMMLKTKNMLKTVVYGSNWFEDMGFYYLGPVDGHNLETLCDVLTRAKELHRPVFLHVETQKGKEDTALRKKIRENTTELPDLISIQVNPLCQEERISPMSLVCI